ncbi:MAG: 50S ribosomal protein L11 methyltransferase [Candidatus Methylomirabilales bacterium]
MFFFYCIDGALAVAAPWWRFLVSRASAGILLKTNRTFPPSHPTTKMCLRLMLQDFKRRRCRTLVDVGCGSGILALAGLKLGVKRAVAVDISSQALATSRANAELNDVRDRLLLVRGSAEALAGRFDMVLANLPMPVLRDKLGELVRLSRDEASLVLSGFQDVDKTLVEQEIARLGLIAQDWLREDLSFSAVPPSGSFTWMAVLARRSQLQSRVSFRGST